MPKHLVRRVTIKDCRVETFRSGGHGGQNQNKRESGVRITHPPSGAVGEARDSRSQDMNKSAAFRRMAQTPKFRVWAKTVGLGQQTLDEYMEEAMRPENIRMELVEATLL